MTLFSWLICLLRLKKVVAEGFFWSLQDHLGTGTVRRKGSSSASSAARLASSASNVAMQPLRAFLSVPGL